MDPKLLAWTERETLETIFSGGEKMQKHKQFLETKGHEFAVQKLRNVSINGLSL